MVEEAIQQPLHSVEHCSRCQSPFVWDSRGTRQQTGSSEFSPGDLAASRAIGILVEACGEVESLSAPAYELDRIIESPGGLLCADLANKRELFC
jgi:hypothetical protein